MIRIEFLIDKMALKFKTLFRKLDFLFKAETSRGTLSYKKTWLIKVYDTDNTKIIGIGEAGPLQELSIDDIPEFEPILKKELNKLEKKDLPDSEVSIFELAKMINPKYPSIRFGVEAALLDLHYGGKRKYFENKFYTEGHPIQINGLVWMGDSQLMLKRLEGKIHEGFNCIKIKIGAIDFDDEMQLLKKVRSSYSPTELELRVDANGAFSYLEAEKILAQLNSLGVHSIEQPIKAGQPDEMAVLCKKTPIPIALDEELIGVSNYQDKKKLLRQIRPQYIILKPTLLGGFASCLEWIELAKFMNIGWWITSALESNIGLNAICQFASSLKVELPQGLGTGGLYANNIESPLAVENDAIYYKQNKKWAAV